MHPELSRGVPQRTQGSHGRDLAIEVAPQF
jgi:hypothetical protein